MNNLFYNAKFYLGRDRWAHAVLAGDDGIINDVFIQPSEFLLLEKPDIRHINLGGGFVFPAFEDAHNHPAARARTLYELDFRKKDVSWNDIKKVIRERAYVTPPDQWIICHGWSDAGWGAVTAAQLDELSQDHGIMLVHISYHGGMVNKKGMTLLKEKGLSPADNAAQKTGRITEHHFEDALVATSGTVEQYRIAILAFARSLAQKGIIGVHDMNVSTLAQLEAYRVLDNEGALPIHAALYLNPRLLAQPHLLAPYITRGYNNVAVAGLKLFFDGAIGMSTAAVSRPYRDGAGSGVLRMDFDACAGLIKKAASLGLRHIAMHCIGDRAVDTAVDVFERLQDEYRRDISVWRFEHFEMPDERAIHALADHGGVASMQPNFSWDVAHYHARLGEDAKRLNPLRAIQDAGVTLAFGSDDMPSGPAGGIHWATRDAPSAGQQLTLDEAIDAYTVLPARILEMPRMRGKIAKGHEANFAVFGKNPFDAVPDADADMPKEVWRRGVRII